MTTTETSSLTDTRLLPGTAGFTELLARIAAGARDRDRDDENPFEQVRALKAAGFGTLRLPADQGGAGFTVRQLFETVIDVAHADPIVAHIFRTHFWFTEERLRTSADTNSRRWLDEVAAGKIVGNAFSEKGPVPVGSPNFATRLTTGDGEYRLTGEKFYSTGTLFADYLTVATSTDRESVATVVVPTDREGVQIIDDWDGFGQRRTGTGTTIFTDVLVREEEILSDATADDEAIPTVQFASLQLYIHAVVAGILAAVVDDGVELLRSRTRTFAHASADNPTDDPLLQRALGQLAATANAVRAVVLDAADAIDAATASERDGVPDAALAAEAQLKATKVKVFVDAIAPQAATDLLELGGASASSRARNLDRHWRNIRTITLHNPVAYKARVIGENLLHGTPVPANPYF